MVNRSILEFMSSDFIFDRGLDEYFHWREEIMDTFNCALEFFRLKSKETTFLIQGASGAGKNYTDRQTLY